MQSSNHQLVVIDPTQASQPSLDRALMMARLISGDLKMKMTFLLLVTEQTRNREELTSLTVEQDWIMDKIITPCHELGVEFSILVSWSKEWAETLLYLEETKETDLTTISFYSKGQNHVLSDDNWKLLRQSQKPIYIARDIPRDELTDLRLLAAIKAQSPEYEEKNQAILNTASRLVELFNADLHLINAYNNSMEFPDRGRLAAIARIDNDKILVKNGDPQEIIPAAIEETGANLLLISSNRRSGIQGIIRGNTVEKIIDRVGVDILMI